MQGSDSRTLVRRARGTIGFRASVLGAYGRLIRLKAQKFGAQGLEVKAQTSSFAVQLFEVQHQRIKV